MSMNHKSLSYLPDSTSQHPMNRKDLEYDRLIGQERNRTNLLSILVVGLLIYVLLSLFLFRYAINLPKSVPMVIEVAPWGEAINVGDISKYSYTNIDVPEKHRQWMVKTFIKNLRSISSDPQIVHDNVSSLFSMITPSCAEQLKYNIRNPDIFSMIGKRTVTVMFDSIIKASEKTYQVDWAEKTLGEYQGTKYYRGLFTIELLEPTEKQSDINCLGVFITNYDIVELTNK